MIYIRPDKCHPFLTAFYLRRFDQRQGKPGRIAYVAGRWLAIRYLRGYRPCTTITSLTVMISLT